MSVAPGTMQPAVNAFDNVSRVGMVTIQFWLKGASLGIYDELGGAVDGVESSMGMLAIGIFNITFFYFWI